MTVYNKASLVLAESPAYKAGKIQPYYPLTPDVSFDFTRSTSATRVNADGNIEKETQNLLLQSNQFDTTWSATNASLTSGQSGYDGLNDAWKLTTDTANSSHYTREVVTTSGVTTASIYAKADGHNFLFIFRQGLNKGYYYNLATGELASPYAQGDIDATITSEGNGWYRCTFTFNHSGTGDLTFFIANADGSFVFTGDGTSGILIQDAQLEQGLVARNYQETTTTAFYGGITDNIPRLDYTDSSCPSVLLEPQRTNLVTQSEYFEGYSNSNSTDEPNATTSPEGLTNATSFLEAATTGQHKLHTSYSFDGSSTYTFSIFAKSNGRDLYVDTQNSNEWGGRAWFDLTAGTANAVLGTADIKDYGNGWYRCIVTGASTLAGGNFIELLTSNGSSNSTTGDITKGVYIYGAQLEEASYATSYIPTYGTSVTRNGEVFEKTGLSGVIGQTEGTLYIEAIFKEEGNLSQWFSLSDGTSNNWVFIGKDNNDIRGYIRANNVVAFSNQTFQIVNNSVVKAALSYESGSISLYINGSLIASSTNSFSFNQPLDEIYSTTFYNTAAREKVNLDRMLLFKTALTDDECIALTTL